MADIVYIWNDLCKYSTRWNKFLTDYIYIYIYESNKDICIYIWLIYNLIFQIFMKWSTLFLTNGIVKSSKSGNKWRLSKCEEENSLFRAYCIARELDSIICIWQRHKGRKESGKALWCRKGKTSGMPWLEVVGLRKVERG